jgi:hypothetical protein
MYSKLLEATLSGVYHEINPSSLLRSPLKMGGALKNKFLVIKIVSSNMLFIFEGQDSGPNSSSKFPKHGSEENEHFRH